MLVLTVLSNLMPSFARTKEGGMSMTVGELMTGEWGVRSARLAAEAILKDIPF